jgi:hypothetical protein
MTTLIILVTVLAAALGCGALGLAFGGLAAPPAQHARPQARARHQERPPRRAAS